jgi:hypothetical protein
LWVVGAWTQGGTVPEATVRVTASPASVTPIFSFGCGSYDGTASCDLGAVDAEASRRQLVARVTVPATASAVRSVRLTVTASAAHLPKDPMASATVAVTAAPAGAGTPSASASPLSVGNLPYLSGASTSPGGNAAGLFPALTPSGTPSGKGANTRTVANTAALPLGGSVVGAQLIGLGVLALAFVLAVTRLSVRRRPALTHAAEPPSPSARSADENAPEG